MDMARCSIQTRLIVALALASWTPAPAADSTHTVILVRHAERAGGMGSDVGLSDAGRCRAEALARMLADAGVKHIYVTEVARTQQTADPLARKLNIRPEEIPAKDVDGLVGKLRNGPPGEVGLVVGHSNTLPEIIKRLGGGAIRPIEDAEYDRMFVVTTTSAERASVVTLHYAGCAQ